MGEWNRFDEITSAKGMYLIDKNGKKLLDGVASMWCNVWGHSRPELIQAITSQAKNLQHSSMFNLTNKPAEELADKLVDMSPAMNHVFFSDNGSTAMEIAFKISLQYWTNQKENKKKIAALKNGYHGDTFGAMSVGYVPEFFSGFKRQMFSVERFSVPDTYRLPQNMTIHDMQNACLEKIETKLAKDDSIAAFVMESGAQVAGGVNIYPKGFQSKISRVCKKHGILLILDEVATGFGRLGSMTEYTAQNSKPDIVAYGKMLTGGYLSMSATLTSKKIFDSFLGKFDEKKHLFHGHTYTGNPIAAAVSNENIQLYKKHNLIRKIARSADILKRHIDELYDIDIIGDVRHKGMLMGIELVTDKRKKTRISPKTSINKIIFEAGRQYGVYLRTLGNIVMLVPPLAMPDDLLELLVCQTINAIKSAEKALNS